MTPNCFLRPLLVTFVFLSTLTGGLPAETSAEARQALALRYIHEILPYWQHRLQLDDWTIHLLLSRKEDLRPGTLGNIHWDREKNEATIRVMDANGYGATNLIPMLKDMQETVVHELIHLELASLPVAEADRSNQEFAIERLTDALIESSEESPANAYFAAAGSTGRRP